MFRGLALAIGALAALGIAAPGAGATPPDPGDYQQDDYGDGSVYNIVPPGQDGLLNALQAAQFELNGTRPPHQADQQAMYGDLVYATPGLQESQILDYFKDASFGVEEQNVEDT
jgi:hypothetical protein